MKKLLLILLCLPMIGFGQGWEQTYDGLAYGSYDIGYSVRQTNDGGYILCGRTKSHTLFNNSYDFWLIRTDNQGDTLWTKTFYNDSPFDSDDIANCVQITNDNGFIIAGSSFVGAGSGLNGNGGLLIRTDDQGDTLWTKNLTTDARYVQQTNDGGFIILGNKLLKTDSQGNILWYKDSQYLTGNLYNSGHCVQQTTDGGYILSFGNYQSFILVKTNSNGDTLWTNNYNNIFITGPGENVIQTSDGGYIICGQGVDISLPGRRIHYLKTDMNGNKVWEKYFDQSLTYPFDNGYSIQQTNDNGYIICGRDNNNSLQKNILLVKLNSQGDTLFSKKYGGEQDEEIYHIQQTLDNGFIMIGTIKEFGTAPNNYIYLIKTDEYGNATSTFNIPINPNRKLEKTVDILGRETKPLTNTPLIEIYDDGSTEKKMIIE